MPTMLSPPVVINSAAQLRRSTHSAAVVDSLCRRRAAVGRRRRRRAAAQDDADEPSLTITLLSASTVPSPEAVSIDKDFLNGGIHTVGRRRIEAEDGSATVMVAVEVTSSSPRAARDSEDS